MGCSNPLGGGLLGLLLALCLLIFSQVSARQLPQIPHAVEASKATARTLVDPYPYGRRAPSGPSNGDLPPTYGPPAPPGPSYGDLPPTYGPPAPPGPCYGCTAYNRCLRSPPNDTPTTEKNTNTKN